MKSHSKPSKDIIAQLVETALHAGADTLDVEYKDGYEEVCAMKDDFGFGIATLDSSSEEARELRKRLYAMLKEKETVEIKNKKYTLKSTMYDSFGEDAFRVSISTGK